MDSAFSALMLLFWRQEGYSAFKTEWWGAGVVVCADLPMAQLMPLSLASVKSRLVFPFSVAQAQKGLGSNHSGDVVG